MCCACAFLLICGLSQCCSLCCCCFCLPLSLSLLPLTHTHTHARLATGRISTVNIMNAFGKWLVVFAFCISSHSFVFMCSCGCRGFGCCAASLSLGLLQAGSHRTIVPAKATTAATLPKTAFSFLRIDWPLRRLRLWLRLLWLLLHASFYFFLHFSLRRCRRCRRSARQAPVVAADAAETRSPSGCAFCLNDSD